MIRLGNNVNDFIPLKDMKDGQIGVIVDWPDEKQYKGDIVMRYGNDLIVVGMAEVYGWHGIFENNSPNENRVRLLHNDEPLYVDNNKLVG
jgi:hypothetical protein